MFVPKIIYNCGHHPSLGWNWANREDRMTHLFLREENFTMLCVEGASVCIREHRHGLYFKPRRIRDELRGILDIHIYATCLLI